MVQPTHVDFNLKRKIVVPPPPEEIQPQTPLDQPLSMARMFWFGIGACMAFAASVIVVWKAGLNTAFWEHAWPLVARDPTMFVIFALMLIFVVRTCFNRNPSVAPPPSPSITRLRRVLPQDDPPSAA
jgi:hypothetical protein